MKSRILITNLLLVSCSFVYGGDVVIHMNEAFSSVVKADTSMQNPGMVSRSMAMTNLAIYDAFNGVSGDYTPFYSPPTAPIGASAEAAAVQAGYHVLSKIYPHLQSQLDANRASIFATLPQGTATELGVAYGDTVGAMVFDQRQSDGFTNMVSYQPTNIPGHWQPDPMNPNQSAWGPEWGQINLFGLDDASTFMPSTMPDLTSDSYTSAFNEVKSLGAKDSTTRTADQTEVALFWAYDRSGMGTPIRMYNQVLRTVAEDQGNTVAENTRLFALASTSMADAGIVAWDSKFKYDFWRPITGIREADGDGNPDTAADPMWEPLGAPGGTSPDGQTINDFTPPFPTYVSGHASFGGALFGSLEAFYETDTMSFDVTSEELPGIVRSFDSFSEAMQENGRSRVYLGIHWDFDDIMARELGGNVAAHMATNHFQAVPEPETQTGVVAVLAMLFFSVLRRRRAKIA